MLSLLSVVTVSTLYNFVANVTTFKLLPSSDRHYLEH